jgi:hypothetical protein
MAGVRFRYKLFDFAQKRNYDAPSYEAPALRFTSMLNRLIF